MAGGIKTEEDAKQILKMGADKISINSPALLDPSLISRLADQFGQQCVVVGIDDPAPRARQCVTGHFLCIICAGTSK